LVSLKHGLLKKNKKNKIYCIGDSHVSVFVGEDRLVPIVPEQKKSFVNHFEIFRLGPVTAYNFCEETSSTNAKQLFEKIINTIPANSWIVVSAGEIDCRVHLIKQAIKQNKSFEEICGVLTDKFIDYLATIKNMGYNVCLLMPPPTKFKEEDTAEYPSFGSETERNEITKCLIQAYIAKCEQYEIPTIGVLNDTVTEDNKTIKKYLWDGIHYSRIVLPQLILQLREITGYSLKYPLLWLIKDRMRRVKYFLTKSI
jgi:hypothetical protein